MSETATGMKARVPRLRFPEFEATGTWRLRRLAEVGDTIGGLTGKSKEDFGTGTPFVTYMQVFERAYVDFSRCGRVRVETREHQNQLREGDILITGSSETPEEVGFASVVLREPDERTYLNSFCFVLRPNGMVTLTPSFSRYLFRSPSYRHSITVIAQGSTRFNLSKKAFLNVEIGIPAVEREQQKIADCLSSLDDVIAAHTDKLAALTQHKQGLLEQLFPREGETVPRLRFPEFRKAVAWESKKLVNVAHVVRGGSPRPIADYQTDDEDGLAWLKIGDVSEGAKYITKTSERIKRSGLSKTREIHSGDLILSNSMSFGRPYLSQVSACIHDGWLAITDLPQHVSSEFMYYLLSAGNCQRYFADAAAGSGVHNLNIDIVEVAPIMVPEEREQIRVADCLSGLDTFITAESDKLAALKQHKQGLLQQLFPAMDEATA